MKNVTVDVIYSMENEKLPNILEVIDAEDIGFTMQRREYWMQFYEKVYIVAGIDLLKQK